MSGKKIAAGAAILILLGVGAFLIFRPEDSTLPIFGKPEPLKDARFQIAEVRALDPGDRPEAGTRAQELSGQIEKSLNSMYTLTILRPGQWPEVEGKDSPVETLGRNFTEEARASLKANIGSLALDDLGPKLDRVDPTKQEILKLSFAIEPDLSAPFAVVSVNFQAEGKAKEDSDDPVDITHTAVYWWVFDGDAYRIAAYRAELKADTKVKESSFGQIPLAGDLSLEQLAGPGR